MNLNAANENIDQLVSWIEEREALSKQFPSFDPDVDLDEGMDP